MEPSLGNSVRPWFKAPCREYCDAFSVENVIFLPREDSGTMREVYENHRQPLGIDDQPLAPTVSWPGPAGSSTTGLHFQAERSRARPKPTRLTTLTHPVSLSKWRTCPGSTHLFPHLYLCGSGADTSLKVSAPSYTFLRLIRTAANTLDWKSNLLHRESILRLCIHVPSSVLGWNLQFHVMVTLTDDQQ